jgi:hypothetical protein
LPTKFSDLREVTALPTGSYVVGYDPNAASGSKNFRIGGDKLSGTGGAASGVSTEQFFDLIELMSGMSNGIVRGGSFYSDPFANASGLNLPLSTRAVFDATNKKVTPTTKDASVLLHFEGTPGDAAAAAVDVNGHALTVVPNHGDFLGSAYISADYAKFGSTSMLIGGGGAIEGSAHEDFGVGTGDFTFEVFGLRMGSGTLYDSRVYSKTTGQFEGGFNVSISGENLFFVTGPTQAIYATGTTKINNLQSWTHIALVRKAGVVTGYVNGAVQFTLNVPDDLGTSSPFRMGIDAQGRAPLGGWFDELRFVKRAVYDGPFTPPTSEIVIPPPNPQYTLVSNAYAPDAVPSKIGLRLFARTLVGVTEAAFVPNVDLVASVSRDGGTTFTPVTLVAGATRPDGNTIYTAALTDVSAQPSGKQVVFKYETIGTKSIEVTSATVFVG